jgi:hypothetical protein
MLAVPGLQRDAGLTTDDVGGGETGNRPSQVLVVDDDPAMQHMLANYLEQHNMHVVSASQRQEVVRRFAVGEPNVVILDLRLGSEDGLDLLREIRSRSDVPVITRRAIGAMRSTESWDWSLAPMITSPSHSLFASYWHGSARCCVDRSWGASCCNVMPSRVVASSAAGNWIDVRDV